jgi:hypothetical protein
MVRGDLSPPEVNYSSTQQLYDCSIILHQQLEFVKFAKVVLVPQQRVKVECPDVDDVGLSTH